MRRILKNFYEVHTEKKVPPPQWRPYFSTDQIFANNFRKGSHKEQSCEIIPKSDELFQRRRILKNFSFWRISLSPHSEKSPPPPPPHHGSHVFQRIKVSRTVSEKDHLRNNLVKLFQNLTSCFRGEEFWRIALKSTQCKKPVPHGGHVLRRIKRRFFNNFFETPPPPP